LSFGWSWPEPKWRYWVNSRLVKVTTSGKYAGSIALISRAAPLEDTARHTVTSQDSRFRYHLRSFYSHVGFGLAFRPGLALSAASCSPTLGQCRRGGTVQGTSPAGLPGWPRAGPRGRSWMFETCPRATPLKGARAGRQDGSPWRPDGLRLVAVGSWRARRVCW